MQKITKTKFKSLHTDGKLSLIQGMVKMDKNDILEKLNAVDDIKEYLNPVSNMGNLTSTKDGYQTINIYQAEVFIFLEEIVDHSKNKNCSRDNVEVFNTIYYIEE